MAAEAITLRLARPRDAHVLAAMSRDLIESGLGWSYRSGRIARLIEDRETTALVACDDAGAVAGFAIMSFGDERAHLVLLAVRPAHRRHAIGRRMIEWLVESAATAGIAVLTLELRAANQAAREFYRVMGFTETVSIADYYRGSEPAIRMVRALRTVAPGA